MDLIDRFRSLFIDDYKSGVESQTTKSILYFNGNRVDQDKAHEILISANKKIGEIKKLNPKINLSDPAQIEKLPEHIKKPFLDDVNKLAKIAGDQLDESVPGLSASASKLKLAAILANGLTSGPYAERKALDTNMCLVNQPLGNQLDPENLLKDGLIGFVRRHKFNPDHFNPLPGNKKVWDRLVGAHEGEHCNQDDIDLKNAEGDDYLKKTIEAETRSDRAAIKDLIANGHGDVAQAWKDIRIIASVDGDYAHSTTLFLEDEKFEINDDQLDEIRNIKYQMNDSVAGALGISKYKAETLRKEDPQKYADMLQQQIDAGNYPPLNRITDLKQLAKISELTGISAEDLDTDDPSNLPQIMKAYKKLDSEGALDTRGSSPEASTRLAQQYIGATRRLMIPNTSAGAQSATTLSLPQIDLTDDGSVVSDEDLEAEADEQKEKIVSSMVAKQLGITQGQAGELADNDPEKYLQAAKDALKSGKVPETTKHSLTTEQKERRQERILGIEPGAHDKLPYSIQRKSEEALKTDPNTMLSPDGKTQIHNPYTAKAAVKAIQEFEQKLRNPAPAADADTSEASKDETPVEPPKEEKTSSLFQQNAADMTSSLIAKVSAPDAKIEAPVVRQRQPAPEALAV